MKTINKGNSVFTNVALTDDGDIWWEGMENTPAHAMSWKGEDWTPDSDELSSHPNSRYCTPIRQCPILADEYDDPEGVPISALMAPSQIASPVEIPRIAVPSLESRPGTGYPPDGSRAWHQLCRVQSPGPGILERSV